MRLGESFKVSEWTHEMQKTDKSKSADSKNTHSKLPFNRKKKSKTILLKRVRQKHSFEETRNVKGQNDALA